jgi:POT family proton-dependent oligopeptide transporter
LLLTYLLHTTGELCLSPVGLSNFTKLAPPRFVSQLMGMWFLATAIGNLAAGQIGGHMGSDVHTMPTNFFI